MGRTNGDTREVHKRNCIARQEVDSTRNTSACIKTLKKSWHLESRTCAAGSRVSSCASWSSMGGGSTRTPSQESRISFLPLQTLKSNNYDHKSSQFIFRLIPVVEMKQLVPIFKKSVSRGRHSFRSTKGQYQSFEGLSTVDTHSLKYSNREYILEIPIWH